MINDVHIIYIIVRQANVEWLSPLPVVLWPGQVRTSIRRTIKDRGMGIVEPFSCLERAEQLPHRGFLAFSHFFSLCRLTFSRQKPSNLRQALFEESIGDNCQRGELWSRKRGSRIVMHIACFFSTCVLAYTKRYNMWSTGFVPLPIYGFLANTFIPIVFWVYLN